MPNDRESNGKVKEHDMETGVIHWFTKINQK